MEEDFQTPEDVVLAGQMYYDEILIHNQEQQEEQQEMILNGQINFDEQTYLTNKENGEQNLESKEEEIKTQKPQAPAGYGTNSSGFIFKSLEDVLHDSMIPYTEHVVMDRALPRVEDGLKPVQRRILYTMLELGLEPESQYRKSARIVGDCMGKYHPHGDSSVYDAMVRMAQPYSMGRTLVDGHGNFGSIDGDSAAAMRYTEAKLTPLAMELLRDLHKNTVHWGLNFDDTLKEPDTLPGRFPNLLVNGAYGIAVGVATNIPPHNLTEVIDGVVAYINKPSITLEEMMKYIKAPDFPTGGQLIVGDELVNAYRTGKGKVVVRATVNIETSGDKQSIVITELPYQTNKAALLQKIAELKESNKDKLSAISEIRDESDRNGMRAVIKIKKEGNARAILDYLFKATGLQVSFGINMVAIAGGKPKQMGLMEIISYYVEYQRQVVYRRTKFDLDACKDRAHIVEGLLVAIKNIDEVVKIIRKSATVAEARLKLKERFNLSDKQTQAILDMRLARLVNLEQTKLLEELKELKAKIEEYTAIVNSKKLQLNVVKEEILTIKKQFKNERQSKICNSSEIVCEEIDEDEAFVKEVVFGINANGNLKCIPQKNYNLAQKEITDSTTLNDVHVSLTPALSSQKILLFTNLGNCLKISVGDIAEAKWRDKGVALSSLDKNVLPNEKVVAYKIITDDEEFMKNEEMIFFTKQGMVKKSLLGEYFIAKTFYQAIKLKEGDELLDVQNFDASKSIIMISENGMTLNFENQEIPTTGRVSSGVKGINLDDGDVVVFADQVQTAGAITVGTKNGYFKNVPIGEFEIMARYRKGLKMVQLPTTGKIIFARYGIAPPLVAIKTSNSVGKVLAKNIPYDSRLGKGKQCFAKGGIEAMFEYIS
ncbi:MAG: DNA topoisomerase 4 subunit A [Clostridia bacterium]|nr:DNA topoisomerase 4 subunit A [Clostridia bacterium]